VGGGEDCLQVGVEAVDLDVEVLDATGHALIAYLAAAVGVSMSPGRKRADVSISGRSAAA
jgi:hypothetical protein